MKPRMMKRNPRPQSSLAGTLRVAVAATMICIPACLAASAQEPAQEAGHAITAAAVVPQQVRHTGKLAVRAGETVEAEFRIYAAPEGGEPLWTEAQQVQVQLDGSYSALLGVASPAGLPQTVFAGGAARWLGVSVDRSPEQERVLLSSVPYAMKSADAESLAGHAASDFVTQEQLAALAAASVPAAQASQSAAASPEARPDGVGPITGVGTTNTIALFTGANAIGNSEIVQSGSDIGINEATPTATLDVGGTANVRGMLSLPATGLATTGGGKSSEPLELTGSAWSTAVPGPVAQNFALETTATGNDTATPGGTLQLLYGSGTNPLAATGFYISNNGKVTFTSGQTVPNTNWTVTAAHTYQHAGDYVAIAYLYTRPVVPHPGKPTFFEDFTTLIHVVYERSRKPTAMPWVCSICSFASRHAFIKFTQLIWKAAARIDRIVNNSDRRPDR